MTRTPEQAAEYGRRYREANRAKLQDNAAAYRDVHREERRAVEQAKRAERAADGLTAKGTRRINLDWQTVILPAAVAIVEKYDTGVTLRQLFYQLVARQTIPNTTLAYQTLSSTSAEWRRAGAFPDLIEGGRVVHQVQDFDGPDDARGWLRRIYRRDRTEGQPVQLILAVEKAGIVAQLQAWYEDLGVPIVALGGYSSVTLERKLAGLTDATDSEDTVIIYAGDFDASGQDIVRNLAANLPKIRIDQVALSADQVARYGLPENAGKTTDSRAAGFVERHGRLVQVELDALDPDTLHALYQAAVDRYWDADAYAASIAQEAEDRAKL